MKGRGAKYQLLLVILGILLMGGTVRAGEHEHALRLAEVLGRPGTPTIRVVDTVSSLGPMSVEAQTVTLADLVRFHGHPCDGLVVAAAGISHGLHVLFPDQPVNRTDLLIAVKPAPCYLDVAAYLTGARTALDSLTPDSKLGDSWILHRRSTGETLQVSLRPGFKPPALAKLEAQLRANGCDRELIATVQGLQRDFALAVVEVLPGEAFAVTRLESYPYPMAPVRPDATKASCGSEPKTKIRTESKLGN